MTETTPQPTTPAFERRYRRLALISLVALVPLVAYVGGRESWIAYRAATELDVRVVPVGEQATYNDTRVALVRMNISPPTQGLPSDRALVRVRLEALRAAHAPSLAWADCRMSLTDDAGRSWAPFEDLPPVLQRFMARRGEPRGEQGCMALNQPRSAGQPVMIDTYFIVPREWAETLRPTLSGRGARPEFLRFEVGEAHR